MSELKATTIYDTYWKSNSVGVGTGIFVYPKSEADKYIAMLKDKANYNEEAYKLKSEELADTCGFYEKELRHYKYKRCLAMAKWCESEAYIHEHGSEYDENLVAWFGKWYERWIKIAEKFKEKSDVPVL